MMKKLLLLNLWFVLSIICVSISAQTITSVTVSFEGSEITGAQKELKIGSTIDYSINYSVPSDGVTYKLFLMQLGPKGENTSSEAWISTLKPQPVLTGSGIQSGQYTTASNSGSDIVKAGEGFLRFVIRNMSTGVDVALMDIAISWLEPDIYISDFSITTNNNNIPLLSVVPYSITVNVPSAEYEVRIVQQSKTSLRPTDPWYAVKTITLPVVAGSQTLTGSFETVSTAVWDETIKVLMNDNGYMSAFIYKGDEKLSQVFIAVNYTDVSAGGLNPMDTDSPVIYPNPVVSTLHIYNIAGAKVELLNLSGVSVYSSIVTTSDASISVDKYSAGIYMVKITKNGKVSTKKVMIK